MAKIFVIGSSNIDMVARVKDMPRVGETVGGAKFIQANGGKGANQAVAAARLGGDVTFVSCVGSDVLGKSLEKCFAEDGIDVSRLKFSAENPTGTALILVDSRGNNSIAVAPGANADLLPEDIEALKDEIAAADYLLVQLEIPMETVEKAVDIAYAHGVKVVLNPAPMCPLSDGLLKKLYLITPNETEVCSLTGVTVDSEASAAEAAALMIGKGVENVIITLGEHGSYVATSAVKKIVPARKVDAVDTTAAGDVFNGALVTALSEGKDILDASYFASVTSSISVTRLGAQPSIPQRCEVDEIMQTI